MRNSRRRPVARKPVHKKYISGRKVVRSASGVRRAADSETVLFLDHIAGIAGDMFAASFVDAGLVDARELESLPGKLGLKDVTVKISKVEKASMQATHIDVEIAKGSTAWASALGGEHSHHASGSSGAVHSHSGQLHGGALDAHKHGHGAEHVHLHTHYRALDDFIAKSKLSDAVKNRARAIFAELAEAEAAAHGAAVDDVAFHEVGAVDSVLDVLMAATCIEAVKPARVYSTPVKLGRGLVTMEHGTHAVPPPASARLSVGMPVAEVPAAIKRPNAELSTPTGLSIIKVLAPEFCDSVPAGRVIAQGMGAGTMDLGSYPNVFRVFRLEVQARGTVEAQYENDRVVEISCTMDDETGERLGWLSEQCLKLGALDVWMTQATGKKNRPCIVFSVLASRENWTALADFILRRSSTFGVRYRHWDRLILSRRFETAETKKGMVRYKIGMTKDGKVLKEKAEFDDLRRVLEKDE